MIRLVRTAFAFGALAVGLGLIALGVVQCANLLERNIALSRELAVVRGENADLAHKQAEQRRTIERLRDPLGAVPEIHDRLRLVRPEETIIYVRGAEATAAPLP